MIDLYVERTGPGVFNEPFNTFSNLSFIIAAWALWRYASTRRAVTPGIVTLIALVAFIGVGSTVFHMFATQWALALDVLGIIAFLLAYLWLFSRNVLHASQPLTIAVVVLYFAASYAAIAFPLGLGRSAGYIPALLFLLAFGVYLAVRGRGEKRLLLVAAGVFSASLAARTVEYHLTGILPMGSHFIWHLLNGVTLYLAVRAYAAERI